MYYSKGKILLIVIGVVFFVTSCQSNKKTKGEQVTIGNTVSSTNTKSPEFLLGEKIYKGKGNCFSCHRLNKKSIGPSTKEIMRVYKEKKGNIIAFLKEEAEPIVAPENYAVMKTNLAMIKQFTDKEIKALETYMQEVVK